MAGNCCSFSCFTNCFFLQLIQLLFHLPRPICSTSESSPWKTRPFRAWVFQGEAPAVCRRSLVTGARMHPIRTPFHWSLSIFTSGLFTTLKNLMSRQAWKQTRARFSFQRGVFPAGGASNYSARDIDRSWTIKFRASDTEALSLQ